MKKNYNLPGVIGGDAQLDQSRLGKLSSELSVLQFSLFSTPSNPENMGFSGVWSMSQLPGLLITLPEDESGGVDG